MILNTKELRSRLPSLKISNVHDLSHAGKTRVGKLDKQYQNDFRCVRCGVQGSHVIVYQQVGEVGKPGAAVHRDVFAVTDKKIVMLTVDHILPRSLAGKDCDPNRRVMCQHCNSRRGNKINRSDWAYILEHFEMIVSIQSKHLKKLWTKLFADCDYVTATSVQNILLMSQLVWPYGKKSAKVYKFDRAMCHV